MLFPMARAKMPGWQRVLGGGGVSKFIDSIQTGTISLSGSNTSATATITSVDTSRSVIMMSMRGANAGVVDGANGGQYDDNSVQVDLQNATTVRARRNGNDSTNFSTVTIEFTVIQFAPRVLRSVQRGEVAITSGNTSGTAGISTVNTAKAFVSNLGDRTGTAANVNRRYACTLALTSSTLITATSVYAQSGSGANVGYEVWEFY